MKMYKNKTLSPRFVIGIENKGLLISYEWSLLSGAVEWSTPVEWDLLSEVLLLSGAC